jgi:hypothetical protein
MIRRNILGLMVCIAVLGVATLSNAGIPDLALSSAVTAAGSEVSVFSLPDGNGKGLFEAKTEGGGEVDATITVTLLDATGAPIFLYPFEDMWLGSSLGGLVPCNGGSVADGSTNISGDATFSGAMFAGGYSDRVGGEKCQVIVNGSALTSAGSDLSVLFNSSDIDGNGLVGLSDTVIFVPLYTGGGYDYSIDFFFDGAITLSDLVLYAGGLNTVCP